MVFRRDETARSVLEEACREEGIEPLGWRYVPVAPDHLGEQARASMPHIEQLAARAAARAHPRRRPSGAPTARAGGRSARAGCYIASLSFRTVTYKALCAADELGDFYVDLGNRDLAVPVRDLPPAVLDEHDAVVGARAAVPLPLPQRRDQHDPGEHQLDARPRGQLRLRGRRALPPRARRGRLGLRDAGQRARVHRPRRPGRPPRGLDARPAGLGGERGAAATKFAAFYRYHAGLLEPWDGPGRARVHRRTRRRSGARPQRLAPASLRRVRGRARRLLLGGGHGARSRVEAPSGAASSGRAR